MRQMVALIPCDTYAEENVYESLQTALRLLGGVERFVSPAERVLLKPNLLGPANPEKAVTTHPAVLGAVARILREAGCHTVSYGDSPGSPLHSPAKTAQLCGMTPVARAQGLREADFSQGVYRAFPAGHVCHGFMLCKGVTEADTIWNLCKMKTHALERITGAVKNLLGCVQGLNKGAFHAKYPSAAGFAEMLVDLHRLLRPRLHVLDGILAMEGNGPTSGTPVRMRVLLVSEDPVALDAVFCALVHLPPALVPTNVAGAHGGLGTFRSEEICVRTPDGDQTVEEAAARYGNPAFDVYRGPQEKGMVWPFLRLLPIAQRPVIDPKRCIRCGVCEKSCPVEGKAVHLDTRRTRPPVYDYQKCIRCFCCQEMCPAAAISTYTPLLRRILSRRRV